MKNKILLVLMLSLFIPVSVFAQTINENMRLLAATPRINKEDLTNVEKAILLRQEVLNTEKSNLVETNSKKVGFSQVFSDYWVSFLALLVSVVGLILGVSGFSMANKKKQKNLKKFFHEIDDAFSCYKMKSKRCEAELYRLQNEIEELLKEGKIDENTFHLLEGRIKKYLEKISPQG